METGMVIKTLEEVRIETEMMIKTPKKAMMETKDKKKRKKSLIFCLSWSVFRIVFYAMDYLLLSNNYTQAMG